MRFPSSPPSPLILPRKHENVHNWLALCRGNNSFVLDAAMVGRVKEELLRAVEWRLYRSKFVQHVPGEMFGLLFRYVMVTAVGDNFK
jgi:hypothetical protein